VIIGGTGKSPLVQKIAQEFLEKGYAVAIASRGITENKTPVYNKISLLSDENLEHFQLLNFKNLTKNLFVLQNKNRYESLCYFKEELKKNNYEGKAVFLLDDGLQNFSCPKKINLCVWQPDLLLNSPSYAMPVGPYREGFGKKSFGFLLEHFSFRVWSRCQEENFDIFMEKVKVSLCNFGFTPSINDIILTYKLSLTNIKVFNEELIYSPVHENEVEKIKSAAILCGIANPDQFREDLQKVFIHCSAFSNLFLEDHASFQKNEKSIKEFIESNEVIVLTFKDFFRWKEENEFKRLISNKIVFACTIELNAYDILKRPLLLSEILSHAF
jgi:tetraacyldisaccharide-1-P 4'-kinase